MKPISPVSMYLSFNLMTCKSPTVLKVYPREAQEHRRHLKTLVPDINYLCTPSWRMVFAFDWVSSLPF